jgi:filamentous hemagglutinin
MDALDLSTASLASSRDPGGDGYDPASTTSNPAWTRALADAGMSQPAGHDVGGSPHTTAASPSTSWTGQAWDWTKHEAAAAGQAVGAFDSGHGHVLTRVAGAAQAVGGAAEATAGAVLAGVGGAATATGAGAVPGIPTMVGGGLLAANGADNAVTGLRTVVTGEFHHTLISQAAGATAHALGASDRTAAAVTNGVDLAQGLAGGGATIATGIARKGAATAEPALATGTHAAESLVDPAHLVELAANGVKFTPEAIVATGRNASGQVVFLETGNESAGLQHIVEAHGDDFANIGVSQSQIPSVVMKAVTEGNVVGYQGAGAGRPIYQIQINGQPQRIAVTTGSNGYIVGANPAGGVR